MVGMCWGTVVQLLLLVVVVHLLLLLLRIVVVVHLLLLVVVHLLLAVVVVVRLLLAFALDGVKNVTNGRTDKAFLGVGYYRSDEIKSHVITCCQISQMALNHHMQSSPPNQLFC